MTTFKQLGLSAEFLKVLEELGFETPTGIQEKAIPLLLKESKDFIGIAQTGTGKTAAFGLPLLEKMDVSNNKTQALILAPTRELGQQIAQQLAIFSKYRPKLNVLAVYGGAPIVHQIKDLRKPQHIIIATPGRLLDLIRRKAVNLFEVKYLVLDEADEMLNMGFKEDLDEILSFTPDEKRTWLFSATMAREIKKIVDTYMRDPIEVRIDSGNKVNQNIEHQYAIVKESDKKEALMRCLDISPDLRGLVFCRTKRDTQNLAEELMQRGYKSDALHGDMSQGQRDRVMKRFKNHELQVLIATDVAARGIDVNDLTHVFHFKLPDDNAYYTHRSGRTARAGKEGVSMVFINGREKSRINRLEKQLDITFSKMLIPSVEAVAASRVHQWGLNILEQKTKSVVDKKALDSILLLFGNLSKEELVTKLLAQELEKLNLTGSYDLNASESSGGDRGGRGGRGGRNGGGGRGRSGGRRGGSGGGGGRSRSRDGRRGGSGFYSGGNDGGGDGRSGGGRSSRRNKNKKR